MGNPSTASPIRETARRPAGFVEGNRDLPQPRCDDGPALGEAGGDARSPAPARPDRLGLCVPGRIGRLGAQPEPSAQLRRRESRPASPRASRCRRRRSDSSRTTRSTFVLGCCGGSGAARLAPACGFAADRILLAKPHRGRAIPDSDRLRWRGAGRRDFARRSLRGVSVGPGRTDGRLGHPGRFGTVPQPDPRQRAGTRESIGPHSWGSRPTASLVTFWVRRQDGSHGGHQHLGGVNAGRTSRGPISKASPSSTGRTTARGSCTTRPDPEIRCS